MTTGDNINRLSAADRGKPEWLHDLIKGESGKPVANLANALLALRSDFAFAGMCRPTAY